MPLYNTIGHGYTVTRREDARIAVRIRAALGDAESVANIGAGTGNYEPSDLEVVAVEPSAVMIGQRPSGTAPVVVGVAESIPLGDRSVDAAMTMLSDQHWSDVYAGLGEMLRVSRKRVVAVTFDRSYAGRFWLSRDYLRYRSATRADPNLFAVMVATGRARVESLPVAHDCEDGFYHAYWRRPAAYLDQRVRNGISVFHQIDPQIVNEGVERLRRDLLTGAWHATNRDLLDLEEADWGYRLVVVEHA